MAAFATASVEMAVAEPDRSKLVSLAWAVVIVLPALGLAWYFGRSAASRRGTDRSERTGHGTGGLKGEVSPRTIAALFLLFALPFLTEAARVAWTGRGAMLEVQLLWAVRNLGLALAALSSRMTFARLSALISLFLVTVTSAMSEGTATIVVVGLFAAAGCLWLMFSYWGALGLDESSGERH